MISRRHFLGSVSAASVLLLTGCKTTGTDGSLSVAGGKRERYKNFASMYGPRPKERFPMDAINLAVVEEKYLRRQVKYKTKHPIGSIIVDTSHFYLYFVQADGMAMRYGVGLGRAGYEWSGKARVGWKRKWPTWTPPNEMIARVPRLKKYSAANGGMPAGTNNPLGARALYIFKNGKDTLYRLHGTTQPESIGKAMSSGCVRMLNHDIIDLYDRASSGARIIVT